jgi:hypothetical protein
MHNSCLKSVPKSPLSLSLQNSKCWTAFQSAFSLQSKIVKSTHHCGSLPDLKQQHVGLMNCKNTNSQYEVFGYIMLFLIQTKSYQELHDQTAHNLDISMRAASLTSPPPHGSSVCDHQNLDILIRHPPTHMVVMCMITRIWKWYPNFALSNMVKRSKE